VHIPAGSFEMGAADTEEGFEPDEEPVHSVTLTRSFAATKIEISQAEWTRVMDNQPSFFTNCGGACPVEHVSLWEAMAYCNVRSKAEDLEACYELGACQGSPGDGFECQSVQFTGLDCQGYRIPTEAEWEYMARAGSADPRYDTLGAIAWCDGKGGQVTHPEAQLAPNDFGLYDIYGNVREWVFDFHFATFYSTSPSEDPTGPESGFLRLSRGGSWNTTDLQCRAAARSPLSPTNRLTDLGFRIVRTSP
jgi:formylglycine-generating enzyme required for sulfatase activity